MISCEEAQIICHKSQYKDASFFEILKLKFHLFVCKACSAFSKKNTKLTTLCDQAHLQILPEQDKITMKQRLQEKF